MSTGTLSPSLRSMRTDASLRKLRLAGCAMLLARVRSSVRRAAVEAAQAYADDIDALKLHNARLKLRYAASDPESGAVNMVMHIEYGRATLANICSMLDDEYTLHHQLDDVCGVPRAFVASRDAEALAADMYMRNDFSDMRYLRDALMDAGCVDDEVLFHCSLKDHWKGCWVVDYLLGKS